MLEKRLEAVEPARQPAVAPAFRWSDLLNAQKVIASLFLLPALAVPMFVVVPQFFLAIWIRFHNKMVGAPARFNGLGDCYALCAEQDATT